MGRIWLTAVIVSGLQACGGNSSFNNNPVQVPIRPAAIDVSSAVVTPSYTRNGGASFPASEYEDGNFLLRSTNESGDITLLGSSHIASPSPVRVVQDSYDVLFRHETGSAVPQNVDTPVQATGLINANMPLAIDVTSYTLTPTFTHNNGADIFPMSEYDDAVFYLRPVSGGDDIFFGNSHTASPGAVQVMAGNYDVIYSLQTAGNQVPANQAAVLMSGVAVSANGPLNIDVSSGRVTLTATLDGAAFPVSEYQQAEFFLRNATTGDIVMLGTSAELATMPITQRVVTGTYDVVYRHKQGNQLPVNTDAVVASGVVVSGAGASVSIDIESVAITPTFSLDGNNFPASDYNDANFYLRGTNNANDVMFIGASEVAPAPVRVISSVMDIDSVTVGVQAFGNYDVLYRHETGQAVPQNSNAVVLKNQTLDTDGADLNVAVASLEVSGQFTLNGKGFPADANNSVQFFLRGDDPDDVFLFAYSDISNEPVRVVSISSYQTYDVFMDHLAGDGVPQNPMHEMAFNKLVDTDGMTLSVDIPAVRVKPSFTLDGQPFPASIYQSATFYLRDVHGGDPIFLGYSYKDNDPVMVIKEDHEIIYEHLNGEQTPQNSGSKIMLLDL